MTTDVRPGRVRWGFLGAVAFVSLALDQATKFWAVDALTNVTSDLPTLGARVQAWLSEKHLMGMARHPSELTPVLKSFWSWRYAENPGAAWSFAANWPESIRVPFFHVMSLAALILIGSYYRKLPETQARLRWALSLVMGGALGNLPDRIVRGYVIDFVDWHWNDHLWMKPTLHFPTFNLADSCITTGVCLIALDSLIGWWTARKAAPVMKAA